MAANNGRSVTDADTKLLSEASGVNAGPGGFWYLMVPHSAADAATLLPVDLPAYGSLECDVLLRSLPLRVGFWGNVLYKVVSRIAAYGWNIVDSASITRRIVRSQQLLHGADRGAGWVPFISKVCKDFAGTNNGAFVEIIRQSSAAGSRVTGIRHLDSLRCWRTGDPKWPVIYTDLRGYFHLMRDYQVMTFVDMPASDPLLRGIGQCAAHRAYPSIVKYSAIERYVIEKLYGRKPLALYILNGVTTEQVKGALASADAAAKADGFAVYMGAAIMGSMRPEPVNVATIELSGLPDRVTATEERADAILNMAHSVGMFIGELKPLEGQYGTGTQSTLLSDSAHGQGFASFLTQWEHQAGQNLLPTTTTFTFTNRDDLRDQKHRADNSYKRALTRQVQLATGELQSVEEAREVAATFGDILPSFITADPGHDADVSDNEKIAVAGDVQVEETILTPSRAATE